MNEPVLPLIEKLTQERSREIGTLSAGRDGERRALPLAAHRIVAKVAECVAEVTVEQLFQNPFQETLEAVYIFPLSGGRHARRADRSARFQVGGFGLADP